MDDCIATPMDAGPLDAPPGGCVAGDALDCTGDTLTTCSADGRTTTATSCLLGCSSSGPRCLTFDPSNGLGSALAAAASEPAIVIPRGATIDTDTGAVLDAASGVVAVATREVVPAAGPKIRVLLGASFSIDDLRVTGSEALAIVAPGEVHIIGLLDVAAHGPNQGPAAISGGDPCVAGTGAGTKFPTSGAGGGGNSTPGGRGGATAAAVGGTAGTTRSPTVFAGGCAGGFSRVLAPPPINSPGGGGGGALHVVSQTRVVIDTSGRINANGGGGGTSMLSSGGGSGGTIIIEAPQLSLTGPVAGIVANGGAGGGCKTTASDGLFSTAAAVAPKCPPGSGGDGGTQTLPPQNAPDCTDANTTTCPPGSFGAGGGAVGTLRIVTRDGGFELVGTPVMSAATAVAKLVLH